jgi:hypothetical protein
VFITEGGGRVDLGSGVLVRLGGREFILTVGHNVWSTSNKALATIAVGRPPDGLVTIIRPGDGSAGRVHLPIGTPTHENPEPDVAVVELTEKTLLPHDREPFTENEIAFFDANRVTRSGDHVYGSELVVTGFPTQFVEVNPGLVLGPKTGTRNEIAAGLISMRVSTISRPMRPDPFKREPPEGRGLHVHISTRLEDEAGVVIRLKHPEGCSGGPVVSPDGPGVLVGLMRGVIGLEDAWDMWCEPAADAVRLLVEHDDIAVASAARRVWSKYEEARSRAPKGPTIEPAAVP